MMISVIGRSPQGARLRRTCGAGPTLGGPRRRPFRLPPRGCCHLSGGGPLGGASRVELQQPREHAAARTVSRWRPSWTAMVPTFQCSPYNRRRIAAVRLVCGSTVASDSARAHVEEATSTAAVVAVTPPPVPAAADSMALTTADVVPARLGTRGGAGVPEADHAGTSSMTGARGRPHGARMLDAPQRRIRFAPRLWTVTRYRIANFIEGRACSSSRRETHREPARWRPSPTWSPSRR